MIKPIPSLPTYYATKDGRIFKYRKKDDNLFQLSDNSRSNSGYKMVQPYKNGKRMLKYVHQLVLEAFVGPRPDNMVCDHINRDKLDNNISNLRYITQSANSFNRKFPKTYKKHSAGKYAQYIDSISQLKKEGVKPTVIAEKLNISPKTVYYVNSYCL